MSENTRDKAKGNLLANFKLPKNEEEASAASVEPESKPTPPKAKAKAKTKPRAQNASKKTPKTDMKVLEGGGKKKASGAPKEPLQATDKTIGSSGTKKRLGLYVSEETDLEFRKMVRVLAHQFPGPSEAGEAAIQLFIETFKSEYEQLVKIVGEPEELVDDEGNVKVAFTPGRRG